MIKFTGTIVGSNEVATYTNGEINLNISMPNKWIGTLVKAELGETTETKQIYEVQETTDVYTFNEDGDPITEPGTKVVTKEAIIKDWKVFDVLHSFATTEVIDPSFEDMQEIMLTALREKYPAAQFEII